jgi:caspase domain-containing protein
MQKAWHFLIAGAFLWPATVVSSPGFADCGRAADYQTVSSGSPEMTGFDPKNREFQFYSKSVALLIGESNYSSWNRLPSVPQEMVKFSAALEAHGFSVSRYNDLTSAEIRDLLICFFASSIDRPDMRVLVMFAGHGATRTVLDYPVGYIVPIDAPAATGADEVNHPEFLKKAIPLSEFALWATLIPAKHAVFIFDSCFSGSILDSRGNQDEKAKPSNYVFSDQVQLPLREFIASGTAGQTVPDPSTFLELLVKALLGNAPEADSNHDGYITGSELEAYLKGWVPKYVASQTPVSGHINDAKLDRGEIVFKIPTANPASSIVKGTTDVDRSEYRPIFIAGGAAASARAYEIENLVTTTADECTSDCQANARTYRLRVKIPDQLPKSAVLAEITFRCVSGNCSPSSFVMTSPPTISADSTSAEVAFKAWGSSSTWSITGQILVPNASTDAQSSPVFDPIQKRIVSVATTTLELSPTLSATPAKSVLSTTTPLAAAVKSLESDDTKTRRSARDQLAIAIRGDPAESISGVIHQVPTASYRTQLGVMAALAKVPDGWSVADPITYKIVSAIATSNTKDTTLASEATDALRNMKVYAYYEVDENGALTRAGQLRPVEVTQPPIPSATSLKTNQILQANTDVYLRAGPESQANVIKVLKGGDCVRMTKLARSISVGSWLQVSPSDCPKR